MLDEQSNVVPNNSFQNSSNELEISYPAKEQNDNNIKPRKTMKNYHKKFKWNKNSQNKLHPSQSQIQDIVRIVSLAENTFSSSFDDDHDKIVSECESAIEFDLDNPQNLDIQGIDRMQTYRKDEQGIQLQREYEIIKREIDKKKLNVEEKERFEEQIRNDKFKLPDLFNINIDPIYGRSETSIKVNEGQEQQPSIEKNVELWRTKDKPRNLAVIEAEQNRRVKALQDRLKKQWEKEKFDEKMKIEAREEISSILAQNDFNQLFEEKNETQIQRKEHQQDPKLSVQYPNTFKELSYFRRKLNRERREARDKCIVRTQVFHELGKNKFCSEKFLKVDEISDEEISHMSPASSDGEDGLKIGYRNSHEFVVRGFHDKFSSEPRGKFLNRGNIRTTKTCLNRWEWIQSSFGGCQRKKILRKVHRNTKDVTDETYDIFYEKWNCVKPFNVKSPVKDYIEQKYQKSHEMSYFDKVPQFKSPKYTKVKSFNLSEYLYGNKNEKYSKKSTHDNKTCQIEIQNKDDLIERLKELEKTERMKMREIKRQRMKYLGFPCKSKNFKEEKSESDSSSYWLPENPSSVISNTVSNHNIQLKTEVIPLQISNLRAPDFREPTLRRHPRRLRHKSDTKIKDSDSRAPFDVPRLQKMDYNLIKQSKISEGKSEINQYFKSRHHHDHVDHTQQKLVRVKYIPKIPKFNETLNAVPKNKLIKIEDKHEVKFPLKAPQCNINWARYVPENTNFEDSQDESLEHLMQETTLNEANSFKNHETSKFNEFIKEKFNQNLPKANGEFTRPNYQYLDADLYRQQILDEQASANACLSSASSSICSNFTCDSGSYFKMHGKKVPLDYLMKSKIPFEPTNENHYQATILRNENQYFSPYSIKI